MASKMLAVGALLASASALQLGQLIENEKLDSSVDELIEELDAGTVDMNELEMLPDDPFEVTYKARGEIQRPRMLAMRGCSGSSAVMVFARNLLKFHGIPVPRAAEPRFDDNHKALPPLDRTALTAELLNPEINFMYYGDIGKAMVKVDDMIRARNQTLFFKGMIQHLQGDQAAEGLRGDDEVDELKDEFKQLNMYTLLGSRTNMLDQVICQVKDCFQDTYGAPVDAKSGKESDLCFARRGDVSQPTAAVGKHSLVNKHPHPSEKHNGKSPILRHSVGSDARSEVEVALNSSAWFWAGGDDYKAELNISNLMTSIDTEYEYVENARKSLVSLGYKFETVNEEDLLEFQTPMKGAFKRAVTAWTTLLKSFGVTPSKYLVTQFLSKYAKTYHNPPGHKDVIYNFDEVQKALKGSKYERLLRKW